jgi:hypothetical protein
MLSPVQSTSPVHDPVTAAYKHTDQPQVHGLTVVWHVLKHALFVGR